MTQKDKDNHRVRSRSLPNIMFTDGRVHKQPAPACTHASSDAQAAVTASQGHLNPKYLVGSAIPVTKKRKHRHHRSAEVLARVGAPVTAATASTVSTSSSGAVLTVSIAPVMSSTVAAPALIQPPPVNAHSLREIDLQEIFKNPQLRHDIIFDLQLQFRPNLDGERGKRKRLLAERYWDSIVAEFEDLNVQASYFDTTTSRLPLMFQTMREILLSLLPVKDRRQVESVLDADMMVQQLQHRTFDFAALARYLNDVFKAHCAPMRDGWVDQMVARIQSGVDARSPRRLVEGLRMVFAILEAMKLDVANHQIRTLRPMLVDSAVEFEQDYYSQLVDKGKTSLNDSVEWFRAELRRFDSLVQSDSAIAAIVAADEAPAASPLLSSQQRLAFVYGLVSLFSCGGDQVVCELPSSFRFDYSRLAALRADLRRTVCINLCCSLYTELCGAEARRLSVASVPDVTAFKRDLVAIVEDSQGNCKWIKNTHPVAVEIARRTLLTVSSASPSTSDLTRLTSLASSWLGRHLQPKSPVYKLVESKALKTLLYTVSKGLAVIAALDSASTCQTLVDQGKLAPSAHLNVDSPTFKDILVLADKVLVLTRFHWNVFGRFYVTYAGTVSEEDDNDFDDAKSTRSVASLSVDPLDTDTDMAVPAQPSNTQAPETTPAAATTATTNAYNGSVSEDSLRQPSTSAC